MSLYLISSCLDVFVPIMGRSGSETIPNVFLAVLTSFTLTIPCLSGVVPIFMFYKKTILKIGSALVALLLVWVVVINGKNPYTETTPMRLHIVVSYSLGHLHIWPNLIKYGLVTGSFPGR